MNLTALLTLIAMLNCVRQDIPKVSYISYMDIWMTACTIIIFVAVGEYAAAHGLCRRKMKSSAVLLDRISRYVMAFIFVVFNAVYWGMLFNYCKMCELFGNE